MMDKKEDVVLIELTGVSKIYRSGNRECRALAIYQRKLRRVDLLLLPERAEVEKPHC